VLLFNSVASELLANVVSVLLASVACFVVSKCSERVVILLANVASVFVRKGSERVDIC